VVRVEHYGIKGGINLNDYKNAVCAIAKVFSITSEEAMEFIKKPSELGQESNKSAAAERKANDGLHIKVEVDTSELDAAIEKAKQLNELTTPVEYMVDQKIDSSNITDPIDSARYAMKYIQNKYGPDKKEKLLVIEIDDMESVPRVIYNGKPVESIDTLDVFWETENKDQKAVKHMTLGDGRETTIWQKVDD
jgi:hypothetical protein